MTNKNDLQAFNNYPSFLKEIKKRIQTAQVKANFSVNRELIILYWNIGKIVTAVQQTAGWGKGVIPRLALDIKNELPEVKGFSERNITRMKAFYREYIDGGPYLGDSDGEDSTHSISPQAVAKLDQKNLPLIFDLP